MAIPLFAIFVLIEAKIAAFPITPGHIIFERSVFASYIVNFFTTGCYYAALYYVPLYLQVSFYLYWLYSNTDFEI